MKLGSLFDGSGGFPLAGSLCGIEPVWAAEVEPYPIAVTRSRFPSMRHLGDISKVNGAKIEPVDIITFGSPCQDLSVAGKQAGIKHTGSGDDETTRSGLFREAVRIIKEMRDATYGLYPRFALWENVPGAFSSNGGEDFRTVLEELVRIPEPGAVMPPVPKGGWAYSDSYCGDGWSLAYRVFDAQYWGVPQRRRRIHLVVDFRGECAREVLFEREGLRGYFAQGGTPGQGAASDAEGSPGANDRPGGLLIPTHSGFPGGLIDGHILDDQGGSSINVRTDGKAPTLRAETHGNRPCVMGFDMYNQQTTGGISRTLKTPVGGDDLPVVCYDGQFLFENHSQDTRFKGPLDVSPVLPAQLGTGGNNTPFVVEKFGAVSIQGNCIDRDAKQNGAGVCADVAHTLNAVDRHGVAYGIGNGQANQSFSEEVVGALNCMHDQQAVAYGVDCRNATETPELNGTLQAKPNGGFSTNCNQIVRVRWIVRRLTPTECARLQGFADRWGCIDPKEKLTDAEWCFWQDVRNTHAAINGKAVKSYTKAQMLTWYNKLHTDSAEYKMWGNGIALPPALYCMQGMAAVLARADDDSWLL